MINYIYFSGIPLFQYALDPFIIFCEHFKYWSSHGCIKSSLLSLSFPLNQPPSMNTFGKSGFYFTTELHDPDTDSQPHVLDKLPHGQKGLVLHSTLGLPSQLCSLDRTCHFFHYTFCHTPACLPNLLISSTCPRTHPHPAPTEQDALTCVLISSPNSTEFPESRLPSRAQQLARCQAFSWLSINIC